MWQPGREGSLGENPFFQHPFGLCFPGFLSFLQSFYFRKRGILRINHLVYVCGLSGYNCTLPLPLSFDLRCKWKIAQSWPTTSLSYFLEMSWLLHLLSTFQIPLRHSLRRMPPGASLTFSWAPPSRFSIKGRQSHWRSREAKPETNSSHAETWILSLQHEGLRCPPVPATHSSCLQHRGARSARWAPFSFPLKLIAPSLGHAEPAEQKTTCTLTFTTRSGKSKRHRSELDHTASLGRCLDENSSCRPQIQLLPGFRLWRPEPSYCPGSFQQHLGTGI